MSLLRVAKRTVQALALIVAFPFALLCGFGRIGTLYLTFAQALALAPGLPGSYLRVGFYRLVLRRCSPDVTIGFGTFFSKTTASVSGMTSIGAYCVIGNAEIGTGCQIASLVNISGGRQQHVRNADGRLVNSTDLDGITIGADCWIGSSAVVMANIGPSSVIGGGAVVVKDISSNTVAAGNPARSIRTLTVLDKKSSSEA